ncbi:MAG TPA: molybdopterin cofactor-binding domain-containing protein [Xanthobacteraceae bacterium]
MTYMPRMNRRAFVVGAAVAGGGLALGFELPFGPQEIRAADGPPEVNAWVVIRPDDTVVIRVARSEMGQGTLTGLAQLVAEELECDWSKVTTEFPTPGQNLARKRIWGNMQSTGSQGIRQSHEYVRQGGAAARLMLIQAAANEWKVPPSECSAANGIITHAASGRSTSFGKVAEAAAKLEAPKDIKLKDPKDWKIAGKGVKRLDTYDKLIGKQVYGIDIKMPGMLIATVKACPVNGGKLKSLDAAKVAGMPGVKKVMSIDDNAVAVVADTFWHAKTALDALPVTWDEGESAKVSSATIAEFVKTGLAADQAFIGNKSGDAPAAIAGAAKKIEAVYNYPFQHHATMEPMNVTVRFTADRCEGWGPTQNAETALASVIEAAGLPAEKCDFYKTQNAGGGFGRRGRADFVRQGVLIAKEMPGTPIKLIWTREEDFTHCTYHPITQCQMTGALDANNNLVGLHMRIAGQSILASLAPQNLQNGMDPVVFQGLSANAPDGAFGYNIPNVLIDHAMRNTHLTAGFWRGVNVNHNAIYTECFMDEIAKAVGQDPLAFRRKYLKPKNLAVVNAAAEKAGWGTPPPQGVFRGLAQYHGYATYSAAVAEVSITNQGRVKIERIVVALDPGTAVNPAQIERQAAGSFVYGLSALLYGEITVKDGAVEQKNFDTYNLMRIAEMPKVEVILMPSGGFWGGIGEPTIAVAAPAVLNAIAAATGKRVRSVPLKSTDLRSV